MAQDEHHFAEQIEQTLVATQERADATLTELHRTEAGFRAATAAEDTQFAVAADAAIGALREAERPAAEGGPEVKLYDDTWEERPAQARHPTRKPAPRPAEDDEDFSERKWTS